MNLGLAQLALKMHAFSAWVNRVSQLSFNGLFLNPKNYQTIKLIMDEDLHSILKENRQKRQPRLAREREYFYT